MSGGSLDYVCYAVEEAAERIGGTPLHDAFSEHLRLVAKALHDCEWVMSCDYKKGDEDEAIRAVLHPNAEVGAATRNAEKALDDLRSALGQDG